MKHEPKNKMVAGQNPRRLMRLRSEAQRKESLPALLGQAEPEHAGAKEAGGTKKGQAPFSSSGQFNIILSTTSYKTLDTTPTSVKNSEVVTDSNSPVNQNLEGVKPLAGPLSKEVRDKLLGKSPLRLVTARSPQFIPPSTRPKYYFETLSCGHTVYAYPNFYWDQGGHLIQSIPMAKRRRCQECHAIELAFPPRKPVQSVREIPARKASEK